MHIQQWFKLPSFFSDAECDEIIKYGRDSTLHFASVLDTSGLAARLTRNVKSNWIAHDKPNVTWLFDKVESCIRKVNDRTLKFELDHLESLQYLEYGPLQFYNTHVDNGADVVATRKYTAIIQLSHPMASSGGNLRIHSMNKERHAPRERGSVVIFPSHLPHRAKPVWYGKRKVLVAWMRGTNTLS